MTWAVVLLSLPSAVAGPPTPPPAPEPPTIEIVPQFLEGQVRLVFAGRDGDAVFVDGWAAGTLPLVTQLAEGPHLFRVEGAAGKVEREVYVTVKPKEVQEIDLAREPDRPQPAAPVPAPAPAPAPAPK